MTISMMASVIWTERRPWKAVVLELVADGLGRPSYELRDK
jgi:hypothetical protein